VGMSISGQLFPPTYFGRAFPQFLMSSKEDPRPTTRVFNSKLLESLAEIGCKNQVHAVIASPSTENDTQDASGMICSTKVVYRHLVRWAYFYKTAVHASIHPYLTESERKLLLSYLVVEQGEL
jgi:hypothetical protein